MADVENNADASVAPTAISAPDEQAVTADNVTDVPVTQTDKTDKILGKFNSVDDLAKSYQELESKLTQVTQQRSATRDQQVPREGFVPPVTTAPNVFEPETQAALDQYLEAKKAEEFVRKNAQKLNDPILAGTVQRLVAAGEAIDYDEALIKAERMIAERLQPKVQEAVKTSFEEGQKVAQTKELLGAVGETGKASQKVDPNNLSARDYAAYFGIPRGD